MKVLAVGDMHRKLQDAQCLVDFGAKRSYDKIVFVGDYADNFLGNHNDTLDLWDFLIEHPLRKEGRLITLMGNHDLAYAHATEMRMLFGTNQVQSGFDALTMLSVDMAYEKKLAESLPLSAELDGVTYSHAGFSERWLEEAQKRTERAANFASQELADVDALFGCQYSPIWQRPADSCLGMAKSMSKTQHRMLEAIHPSPYPKGMKQVFGHTPVRTCINLHLNDDVWCIDTFSQHRSGDPIGDRSVLEVIDGEQFHVIPESVWSSC